VFTTSFCPSDPSTIAIAGSKGNLQIWDCSTNAGVKNIFGDRLKELGKNLDLKKDGVVGVQIDDIDERDDDMSS
jgi:periodic tryptophan protein 1